jgi:hypothetical protein
MGIRFLRSQATKTVSASLLALGVSSCAILKPNVIEPVGNAPAAPVEVTVPGYAGVPHPVGLQIGDLLALFASPDAPKRDSDEMKNCAKDYTDLEKRTKSKDELKQGILELVRKEPIRYHWCFYHQILTLEESLRKAQMLDERQSAVVTAYRFLAPLSRAFFREFHDSRYLRWAVSYYRRASELAFYRRVETSPGLTQELIGAGTDDVNRGITEKSTSVLEKYGIIVPERLQPGQRSDEIPKGDALPSDAYVDTGSGVVAPDAVKPTTPPDTDATRKPAAEVDTTVPTTAPDAGPAAPRPDGAFPATDPGLPVN